ncbi:unnamed protein product [Schistocephalus solidus]|uniref:Ectonucleoside triphosphate diphosphohydrolase 1 n=1 Tax=Schistocephalus solidus TaxID=70667 RepID=A0A183TC57_SCHSO|nr:unnamed protein product [Schistocephalus solidus]
MIDAGSTSSKVSVMRWRDWPFRSNGYTEELAITKFGRRAHMFTAFSLESPLNADAIIDDLRRTLRNFGLTVSNPYSDIRIISGNDEGIYAWITVNYLSKKLGDENGKNPDPPDQMMGALDLGGASTQIAFVPERDNAELYTGSHYLFGNTYNVYSYSFLCYGKSTGQNRIWAEIIGQQSDAFAGFYFVINFLFPSIGKGLTRDQVKTKVDEFCASDWNTVAGTSVSWALGYVIDASGMIQSLAPKIDLGQAAFIGSVTVLSIVFLALLGIIIYVVLKQ